MKNPFSSIMGAGTDESIDPVFGTLWTYDENDAYMALWPVNGRGGDAWWFMGLYTEAQPFEMYGFYGGDSRKRLVGYKRVDE